MGKGMVMWGLLLIGGFSSQAKGFWGERAPTHSEAGMIRWCESKILRLHEVKNEDNALACANFYFFHQELEDEGELFTKTLAYLKQAQAINPRNSETQLISLWLHYSRWTSHKNYPETYPNYAHEIDFFYRAAELIESSFSSSPSVLKELGDQINFVRHHYGAPVMNWVLRLYERAEALAVSDLRLKVRCRLDIAHLYRLTGDPQTAIEKYRWVQTIDPANKVAARYLSQLDPTIYFFTKTRPQ